MKQVMFTVDAVRTLIKQGRNLLLAADERVLSQLPTGNWIGGTIPYFMTERGGQFTQEHIYVTELPEYIVRCAIRSYSVQNIANVYADIPENGVGFILIPAASPTLLTFALNVHNFEHFALRPLIGWITGVNLSELGKTAPKIFDGATGEPYEDGALVMHITLPESKIAEINILNIFEQGAGDVITFPHDGFCATEALINGEPHNLADYIQEHNLDTRLPLVADYNGAMINTSFQQIDSSAKRVDFYAPVFRGIEYKHAKPVGNYVSNFLSHLHQHEAQSIFFSCNCILNYLYSELEGKQTGNITGPMTFGEIAYQLLNQNLVYLTISDLTHQ
ncbi:hypothetical protein U27_01569 [Candidatus Vecturithrix granuli]|uniref:Uncharacterized protein n=1 Tax=Vecturithrix granuli TaxID=1499967 RepID=A0A081CAR3_VECG1|nr:hypothetical protein U27_01569 [Candidatus Vecturithrix granuli]